MDGNSDRRAAHAPLKKGALRAKNPCAVVEESEDDKALERAMFDPGGDCICSGIETGEWSFEVCSDAASWAELNYGLCKVLGKRLLRRGVVC